MSDGILRAGIGARAGRRGGAGAAFIAGFVVPVVMTMLPTGPAAAEFALAVSPPRFELRAEPGQTLRQTLELTNAAARGADLAIRTADWTLEPDGSVTYFEELQPGSCRPWVAIERRELTAPAGRPVRFRFEVTTPGDAAAAECRFALLIEGRDTQSSGGPVPVPFNGRLAVIVYLAVGQVEPRPRVLRTTVIRSGGATVPALEVRNDGDAHARLDGFLDGVDAAGVRYEVVPASVPILPGRTRVIPLTVTSPDAPDEVATPRLPLRLSGRVEWGANRTIDIDQRVEP